MSPAPAIGFIGFGEAGSTIALGLGSVGIERLFAFDNNTQTAELGPKIQARAAQSRTRLVGSSADLAESSDLLLSTATSSSALDAARQTVGFLHRHHTYVDLTGRVVVHGERRAREMEEVAATLRAIGIEPIMAEAAARRQDWSARLSLRERFGPDGPATYREMVAALSRQSSDASREQD